MLLWKVRVLPFRSLPKLIRTELVVALVVVVVCVGRVIGRVQPL